MYMSKRQILIGGISALSWGSLGAYRGVQYYNKKYRNDYKKYINDPKYRSEPKYYYLTCFGVSCWHFLFYANPVLLPITVIQELYNLEETIRGIKNDEDNE